MKVVVESVKFGEGLTEDLVLVDNYVIEATSYISTIFIEKMNNSLSTSFFYFLKGVFYKTLLRGYACRKRLHHVVVTYVFTKYSQIF